MITSRSPQLQGRGPLPLQQSPKAVVLPADGTQGPWALRPATLAGTDHPMGSQTRRLLEGRIAPTLLRLAAPNIAVMLAQAAVNTGETYFVGWLGPEALAGVSLVFP